MRVVYCEYCRAELKQPAWRNPKFCGHGCVMVAINKKYKFGNRRNSKATTPAASQPSLQDIAWAAGIYEGEGHARFTGTLSNSTRVCVAQKDDWLLRRMQELFGGTIYRRRAVSPKNPHACDFWYLSGSRARGFLMTIFTFLSPRRKTQAKEALCA